MMDIKMSNEDEREEEGKVKALEEKAYELWEAVHKREVEAKQALDFQNITLFGDAMRTCMSRSPLGYIRDWNRNMLLLGKVESLCEERLETRVEDRMAQVLKASRSIIQMNKLLEGLNKEPLKNAVKRWSLNFKILNLTDQMTLMRANNREVLKMD